MMLTMIRNDCAADDYDDDHMKSCDGMSSIILVFHHNRTFCGGRASVTLCD